MLKPWYFFGTISRVFFRIQCCQRTYALSRELCYFLKLGVYVLEHKREENLQTI
jgi:hypothetical protein